MTIEEKIRENPPLRRVVGQRETRSTARAHPAGGVQNRQLEQGDPRATRAIERWHSNYSSDATDQTPKLKASIRLTGTKPARHPRIFRPGRLPGRRNFKVCLLAKMKDNEALLA